MSLLIRNGRIIDPEQSIDRLGAVLIVDGRIVRMGEGSMSAHTVIDAKGMIVCPGFIDLHCHLRQPGFEEKETIASGTRAAARGGFTTVCCMPNTLPPIATPAIVEQVQKIAAIEGAVRVLPIAAVTEDRNGRNMADLSDLHAAGAVAFSDDGGPVA
ncbi:MAG: amidohydrolase family protein, partial [Chloroflexota bacterium]|nr:amidohydrolase family protein [Chloroflexota bacterium]